MVLRFGSPNRTQETIQQKHACWNCALAARLAQTRTTMYRVWIGLIAVCISKSGYREMIAALMRSEPVQAAQEKLIARRGRLALLRSTCWARAMQRERPTFREFLFFFDYLVQNGDSFTKDGSLQNVAARMQVPNETKLGNDGQARLKITQLKEWLEADFKHMRRHTRDHGDYAKERSSGAACLLKGR